MGRIRVAASCRCLCDEVAAVATITGGKRGNGWKRPSCGRYCLGYDFDRAGCPHAPALGFFYGGMVRRKNILSTLNLSFITISHKKAQVNDWTWAFLCVYAINVYLVDMAIVH